MVKHDDLALQLKSDDELMEQWGVEIEPVVLIPEIEHSEIIAVVLEIVMNLPSHQREAWRLRYAEERTFEEIAEAMGTPLGTAKTRVRRAVQALGQALQERGITNPYEDE